MKARSANLAYIAPVFRVADLTRALAPRDQAAFERDEHIDACIVVHDVRALSVKFAAGGVAFSVPLRQMSYGSEFYIRDPDGYILGFVQPAAA